MMLWDAAKAGLGAGAGVGVSAGARLVVPHPLLRFALESGGIFAASFIPDAPLRYGLQGALVVSAIVDLFHLKTRIQHADAPRGGVGALEEQLASATSFEAPVADHRR